MATYKEIKGTGVQNFSSDPANPIAGQVWYNTTSGTLKLSTGPEIGAWATGNSMNTSRFSLSGAGTQTAALAFGGRPNSGPTTAVTESYNGTNWTEVNDLNAARKYFAGCGANNTAALAVGGQGPSAPLTETWNGTNWTEVNDLNLGRFSLAAAGTNTAALAFGGQAADGNPTGPVATETWNGTSWTEVNDLNTGRSNLGGAGTNTAALAFGGTPLFAATESWNGTSWTEVNDLNTARAYFGSAGKTNTAALAFGGNPAPTGQTESWNGTNWTEGSDLNTARRYLAVGAVGTNTAALAFGGYTGSGTAITEEWSTTGGTQTISTS